MQRRRLVAGVGGLAVGAALAAAAWFAVTTTNRVHTLAAENQELRTQLADLSGSNLESASLAHSTTAALQQTLDETAELTSRLDRLERALYDVGGPSFADPSIDDLDRRLRSLEVEVSSLSAKVGRICTTLSFDLEVIAPC